MIARFATRSRTWTVVAAALVLGLGAVALTDAAQQPDPGADAKAAKAAQPDNPRPPAPGGEGVAPDGFAAPDELAGGVRTIGASELVTVSVMDLVGAGVETVKTSRVDGEGNISLPYVGKVKAVGLDSAQLEQAIAKAYKDKGVVQNALVVVSLPGRGESHQLSNKARQAAGVDPGMPGVPGGAMMGMEPGMMGMGEGMDLFVGPDPRPIDPAMQATLDRKIPEVSFDGVPLSDVVDFLRDVTSVNVFVDWRALEAAGIERNAPVNTRLRDVPFKDALAVVLRGVDHSLRFTVENGVLQIGVSGEPKPAQLVVRGYDVDDLLQTAADRKAGGSALAAVISQTVRPEFWRPHGPGTVSSFGMKVVVSASEDVHRDVEALLKVLRQPSTTQPSARKPVAGELSPEEEALWREKYAPHLRTIGEQSNREQLQDEFKAELERLAAERRSGESH